MRIAVLSDLHAFCSDARKAPDGKPALPPSLIDFSASSRKPNIDPLVGFVKLFESGEIEPPDLMIVGGDLGDKADTHAIQSVWRELSSLSGKYPSTKLVATCGNHDLDTRHKQNKFDPRGFLRTLEPGFPFPNTDEHRINLLEYWANNFSIFEGENYRILNINSCAFHGFGSDAEPELERGRVSDITLESIEEQLKVAVKAAQHKQNICLFHHHIRPVSTDAFDDNSTMKGSERLADLLSKPALGEWLIIHGHRHRSNLFCAGGNSAPIVLSCASFAATRTGDEHNPSPNQFYMVDLEEAAEGQIARVAGSVRAWNWAPSIGWQTKTSIPGGLPVVSGFGYRGYIPDLARSISEAVKAAGKIVWTDLITNFPDLGRLMPTDNESLIKALETVGVVATEADGQIKELAQVNA
ncbi:metallophosphoesterase family protein [Agrobacterium sp. NPDC090273]|uniref:metallophosphoesterase family protein n=1 Tax=Agrobacterium sp. NPDC090273 TaxID=3363919 RepID=UPI00383BEECE